MAKSNPSPAPKPAAKPVAKPSAAAREALIKQKVAAGLPRHQAEEVADRQLEHDAALGIAPAAEESAPAAEVATADAPPAGEGGDNQ